MDNEGVQLLLAKKDYRLEYKLQLSYRVNEENLFSDISEIEEFMVRAIKNNGYEFDNVFNSLGGNTSIFVINIIDEAICGYAKHIFKCRNTRNFDGLALVENSITKVCDVLDSVDYQYRFGKQILKNVLVNLMNICVDEYSEEPFPGTLAMSYYSLMSRLYSAMVPTDRKYIHDMVMAYDNLHEKEKILHDKKGYKGGTFGYEKKRSYLW